MGKLTSIQSKLEGNNWSEPVLKMSKVVNTDANETFASYDPQDIKVYYVSDGGHGGDQDIIFSGKKDNDEKYWGKGQSAGHEVNWLFMKDLYLWHQMGKVCIFLPKDHSSIGGYDIFVSYRDKHGLWGKPINLGHLSTHLMMSCISLLPQMESSLIFLLTEQEEKEEWISIKLHSGVLQRTNCNY